MVGALLPVTTAVRDHKSAQGAGDPTSSGLPSGGFAARSSASTDNLGSMRSSQAGNHQFDLPSSIITDGTMAIRMKTASTRIAAGESDAELLDDPLPTEDEGTEHEDHDERRRGDRLAGGRQAVAHGDPVVARLDVLLVDPGDEEDLVVHGQPEEDGEQHHGQERLYRPGAVDAR